ncbi:hypothetical protein EQV77_04860 [Halobacillus fulvus]|nr:hypothetical protein EQV77_04860 [Halobacillus fulvus]
MIKRIVWFMCIITVGCSAGSTTMSSQSIPSEIGAPNEKWSFTDHHPWEADEIYEKTEYDPFTGEYFKGLFINNPFFMAEPNEKVGSFESFPVQTVRVQLVERNLELDKVRVVKEEVFTEGEKLTFPLPEETDVLYSFSQEVLNDEGEVLDTDVVLYYVPPRELNGQVSIEEQTAERLTLRIENWGPTWLFFGKEYFIQEKKNENWRTISNSRAMEDIGYSLSPGEVHRQPIHLDSWYLGQGTYRVVKPLEAMNTDLSVELAAEFTMD